jgi:hypothetical protein
MAHIAPYRSRTCWQKHAAKAGKTRLRLAQLDLQRRLHAKAPRKFAQRPSANFHLLSRLLLASHPTHAYVVREWIICQRLHDAIDLIIMSTLRKHQQLGLKLSKKCRIFWK